MLDSVLACKIYFAVHNDNSVGENALSIKKYPHWVKQGRPHVFRNKYLTLLKLNYNAMNFSNVST